MTEVLSMRGERACHATRLELQLYARASHVHILTSHCAFVLLSHSGDMFASGGMDNTVKVWSLEPDYMQAAIAESYTQPAAGGGRPFKTRFEQVRAACVS